MDFDLPDDLELIRRTVREFAEGVIAPVADMEPGLGRLRALCDSWLAYSRRRVFPGGCFFYAVSAEFDESMDVEVEPNTDMTAAGYDEAVQNGVPYHAEPDILACADVSGEIADGAAQEPGAKVEAERERCVRHGLEEDGAVARPGRVVGRLANEPCSEQRLQRERDGRLRDPGLP